MSEPPEQLPSEGSAAPTGPVGTRDEDLIRLAQEGDEDAFARLVRRHQDRAYRVARNLVGNHDDAVDLAQDAFLRVFKSLDRFDFQHEFSTWLHRIVTNLGIDHLRRRRPVLRSAGGEEDEPPFEPADEDQRTPLEELDASETRVLVRECIESLSPHFRAVLQLRELEGLPCTEIARIVGATHVTVRWRLHRGRKLFLEEWERRARLAATGLAGKGLAGNGLAGAQTSATPSDPADPSNTPRRSS